MGTKVISVRVTEEQYERLMLKCHHQRISLSELIQRDLVIVDALEDKIRFAVSKLNLLKRRVKLSDNTDAVLEKIDSIINFLAH